MVERMVWGRELETGVRAIDLQHEELIGMLNRLIDVHETGDPAVFQDVLRQLDAYILFHFSTEEALMRGMAGAEGHVGEHVSQHRGFLARVSSLRTSAGNDAAADVEALVQFLTRWLLAHIMKTDRQLAAWLNARR